MLYIVYLQVGYHFQNSSQFHYLLLLLHLSFLATTGTLAAIASIYEHGMREPNHKTTVKIADYFNPSLDYLLGSDSYLQTADDKK